MTYFSIGDVSDGQFPIGVLRRLSDASPTGALREGVSNIRGISYSSLGIDHKSLPIRLEEIFLGEHLLKNEILELSFEHKVNPPKCK